MGQKKKSIRVKLIANPGAGDVLESASRIEQVRRYLEEDGLKVDVVLAHPKKEATPMARKAIKDGYDIVVSMGGDGTLGAVIQGIAGSKIRLGIIAAGTENNMATSIGIPQDLKEACSLIASGHTRKLDLGHVSVNKKKKCYFFMGIAIGLTATVYPLIKEVPEGKLAGIKDAIASISAFKSKNKVFLTLDDESKIKVDTMLVTIANTPLSGKKNLIAPDASMEDGLLDIAVYPGFNKGALISYFLKSSNEKSTPDGKIQRYQARKIKVKASPKLEVAADVTNLGKGTARIKLFPGVLRVIAPEPSPVSVEKPKE